MQYSVRNRRRLRPTGEQAIATPRTSTSSGLGIGVPRTRTTQGVGAASMAMAIDGDGDGDGAPLAVRAEGSGLLRTDSPHQIPSGPIKEIVPAHVIEANRRR